MRNVLADLHRAIGEAKKLPPNFRFTFVGVTDGRQRFYECLCECQRRLMNDWSRDLETIPRMPHVVPLEFMEIVRGGGGPGCQPQHVASLYAGQCRECGVVLVMAVE